MTEISKPKLRRLAVGMNQFESEWLRNTISYALNAGLDPRDVIARGSWDGKVIDDRAKAFARRLTRPELEWFAEHGGNLYAKVRRGWKRSISRNK